MKTKLNIPIWVLNLERDSNRRHFMQQQLNTLGVDFELIKAVDKETLTQGELRLYSKRDALKCMGRELSNGEIACTLSHAKMWQRMVDEQLPEVLILEDDVRVGRSLFDVLANRHKFPHDTGLINFSTHAAQQPFGEFITDIHRASDHLLEASLTSAYYLTRDAAQKLLDKVYPIRWVVDAITARTYMTQIKSYGIYPAVAVVANDFTSSIWNEQAPPSMPIRPGIYNIRHLFYSWQLRFKSGINVIRFGSIYNYTKGCYSYDEQES